MRPALQGVRTLLAQIIYSSFLGLWCLQLAREFGRESQRLGDGLASRLFAGPTTSLAELSLLCGECSAQRLVTVGSSKDLARRALKNLVVVRGEKFWKLSLYLPL